MTNEIAVHEHGVLERFGTDYEVEVLMRRQASIYGIAQSEIDRPDVQAALVKATQLSINYGLMPGVHLHMLPFNKNIGSRQNPQWTTTYVPDVGEKAWKDSADKTARMDRFHYMVETRRLTVAETKQYTPDGVEYTPDDCGCAARVLRTDHAEIMKMMGREYDPEWSYGFWRKRAKKKSNGWEADTIPNGRQAQDVAERRAYKAALMKVFTLVPLDEYAASQMPARLNAYVEEATSPPPTELPADRALPMDRPEYEREENGDLLFAMGELVDDPPVNGHDTGENPDDRLRKRFHALGHELYGDDWNDNRHRLCKWVSQGRTESSAELTQAEMLKLINGNGKPGMDARVQELRRKQITDPDLADHDLWDEDAA